MEDAEERDSKSWDNDKQKQDSGEWREQTIKLQYMFRILAFRVIASQAQALLFRVPSTNSVAARQVQTLPSAGPALLLELIVPPSMLTIGTCRYASDAYIGSLLL